VRLTYSIETEVLGTAGAYGVNGAGTVTSRRHTRTRRG